MFTDTGKIVHNSNSILNQVINNFQNYIVIIVSTN